MSSPRTPTTTTSAATTTPNATPNEPYDVSPATPTAWATPSASTRSKPHNSPNAASLTAIFAAVTQGTIRQKKVATQGLIQKNSDPRFGCSEPLLVLVGDTEIEPVTSSVSGINAVLCTPPLSTKTTPGHPLMS